MHQSILHFSFSPHETHFSFNFNEDWPQTSEMTFPHHENWIILNIYWF